MWIFRSYSPCLSVGTILNLLAIRLNLLYIFFCMRTKNSGHTDSSTHFVFSIVKFHNFSLRFISIRVLKTLASVCWGCVSVIALFFDLVPSIQNCVHAILFISCYRRYDDVCYIVACTAHVHEIHINSHYISFLPFIFQLWHSASWFNCIKRCSAIVQPYVGHSANCSCRSSFVEKYTIGICVRHGKTSSSISLQNF